MYKMLLIAVVLALLGGGGYWYALRSGWLDEPLPSDPPTAEELRRIEEVDRSSGTQARDAVPGAGVLAPESRPPAPIDTGTTTESTTTDAVSETAGEDATSTEATIDDESAETP